MSDSETKEILHWIYRRMIVRSLLLALCAIGFIFTSMDGGLELSIRAEAYILVLMCALLTVSIARDLKLIKNKDALRKAAIEKSDERAQFVTHKATRTATAFFTSGAALAICALNAFGMTEYANVIAISILAFLLIYLICWGYYSRSC